MSVKSLRFEPYPASKAEARKPAYDDAGKPNWTAAMDIPEDTDVRIETLPERVPVFSGKVSESISRNFQPGKYVYVMEKFLHARKKGVPGRSIRTHGEFLVDVTEEQWSELMFAEPKMVKVRQTSTGPKLVCTFPSCSKQSETRLAAFLHEAKEHLGVDPLKNPEKAVEVELRSKTMSKQIRASKGVDTFGPTDVKVVSEV